jgi:hypothetical protein
MVRISAANARTFSSSDSNSSEDLRVMSRKTAKTTTYGRIGTAKTVGTAVPIPDDGMGTRISALCDVIGTRKNAAVAMGVSADSLQRYIRQENMPPFDVLVRLCAAAGGRLDWLATGQGPMLYSETAPQGQSHDVRLEGLTMAIQLAAEALDGKYLPPEKYAELVTLIYQGLEEGLPEATILRFARIAKPD